MRRIPRILSMLLAAIMVFMVFTGCSKEKDSSTASDTSTTSAAPSTSDTESTKSDAATTESDAPDTITALVPPITPNFQNEIPNFVASFQKKYPNLTLTVEPASWEDMSQKLDIQVNAGSPPDIAFLGQANGAISKYLSTEMLLDISKAVTQEILDDYDPKTLEYMKNGDGLYGLPFYMGVHSIGGNREFLEEAGIDWRSVQKNGWTFDEFREMVKKGVKKEGDTIKRYGFVYACSGVTAMDFLEMLAMNAGMPAPFDKDLKYAYTDPNFLEVLKFVRALIDDGSMPKESNTIDAGKRWNMMLTGQTMITGKGMPIFENSAKANNAKLDANDPSAVKDSIHVDYIVLPAPTLGDNPQVAGGGVDGYLTFRQGREVDQEHVKNVVKAAYHLSSGEVAAMAINELFLAQITKSGREASKNIKVDIDPDNLAMTEKLTSIVFEPRPDISAELGAKATKIREEVIKPKFQALLANEITPEQMYDEVKKAAIAEFGEDGVR